MVSREVMAGRAAETPAQATVPRLRLAGSGGGQAECHGDCQRGLPASGAPAPLALQQLLPMCPPLGGVPGPSHQDLRMGTCPGGGEGCRQGTGRRVWGTPGPGRGSGARGRPGASRTALQGSCCALGGRGSVASEDEGEAGGVGAGRGGWGSCGRSRAVGGRWAAGVRRGLVRGEPGTPRREPCPPERGVGTWPPLAAPVAPLGGRDFRNLCPRPQTGAAGSYPTGPRCFTPPRGMNWFGRESVCDVGHPGFSLGQFPEKENIPNSTRAPILTMPRSGPPPASLGRH